MFQGLRWLQSLEDWLQELFSEEGLAYLIPSSEKAEVQIGRLKNELSSSVELPYTNSLLSILSTLKRKLRGKRASFSLINLLTIQDQRVWCLSGQLGPGGNHCPDCLGVSGSQLPGAVWCHLPQRQEQSRSDKHQLWVGVSQCMLATLPWLPGEGSDTEEMWKTNTSTPQY